MLLLLEVGVVLLLLCCPHRAVEAVVREHSAGVAVVTLIHRGHRGEGGGGLVVRVVSLGVIRVSSLCLDPSLLLAAQQLVQILDVAHGVTQNLDLGHLLHGGHGGDIVSEDVKSLVKMLHSVPLSLVPLDCFQILSGFYFVSVNWMENVTGFGRHGGSCAVVSSL